LLLSGGCRHDSGDDCVFHLESVGEVLCYLRRNRASRQHFGERSRAVSDLTVAQAVDKLAPTYPECSCALQNKPADPVFVLAEARLNRYRARWPSIRSISQTRPATLAAQFGPLVVAEAASS
jgi:hypothetical protein